MSQLRAVVSLVPVLVLAAPAPADVVFLGKASFPGTAADRSGLSGKLEDGSPRDRLGGHGSAIAYTGRGDRFVMVSDRGPGDGAVSYECRMHLVDVVVAGGPRPAVTATLRDTVLLKDEGGRPFLGRAAALAPARRFDPEGVRVGRDGSVLVSDEYGPFLYRFAADGTRRGTVRVPDKFRVARPRAEEADEAKANDTGRVPNKGLEGLAVTPDGRKVVAALQAPLTQDGGRAGTSCRLVEIDLGTGASREFVYPLAAPGLGLSEILAVNDREFLVVERDGKRGRAAREKKIVRVDLSRATDVSARAALPRGGLPAGVVAAEKHPFLDLLDPRHGLAGPDFPGKVEGLAFGPDLPDGRRLLLVTTDNDFQADQPTWVYAFAVDRASLPGYRPQAFDRPE